MSGIYNIEKMKQKPVYPTRETPQYSDWALFNMGKELEDYVDTLSPGGQEYTPGDGIAISEEHVISNTKPNVQADYSITDSSDPSFIKNKPAHQIPEIGTNYNSVLCTNLTGDNVEWRYFGKQLHLSIFDSVAPIDKEGFLQVLNSLSVGDEVLFSQTECTINVNSEVAQYALFGKITKCANDIAVGSIYTRKSSDFSNKMMLSQMRFVLTDNLLSVYEMDGTTGHTIESFIFSGSGRILISYFN